MDKVILFEEYVHKSQSGFEFSPYIYKNKWFIAGDEITLQQVCKLCNLDDEEMSMLVLKYGVK